MVFTNVVNPRSHIVRKSEYRPTLVKRGATIGANATVVCGVTLGKYSFIGAGTVVTCDAPDYALMVGVPARQVGWICNCGNRLQHSAPKVHCDACGRNYHIADGLCRELTDLVPVVSQEPYEQAIVAA
jgi:UDP-2-acetamido-3-amino-2,3-dideoxy-glucuronate N-acetyltransferase